MKTICIFIAAAIICTSTFAQYTKLLNFAGSSTGSNPIGSLISDGTFLYGMTQYGGTNNMGVIFKIKSDGTGYTKLLDFAGSSNGQWPYGSLISDGTFLYGMTTYGGINSIGVIFKIQPNGTGYTKLFDFAGSSNGSNPYGSLISDGTFLYGMTSEGGTNDMGVIFKIKSDGTGYTKLLDFAGSSNGSSPLGSLISDGTFLYGMTGWGGINNYGVIFKIKPDGTGYSKLLDFTGRDTGKYPYGSLILDGTFLYGMTTYGGFNGGTNNDGVLFKIKSDGTGYAKLLDFDGIYGTKPQLGYLISYGTFLYGMTSYGGTNNKGVIFKIKPDGTGYVKLLDFAGASNGSGPSGSLISDGTFFYGITTYGGSNDDGVIFKFRDTTNVIDTCFITVYDTVTVNDTIIFNDTITTNIFDTTFVTVNDTTFITINDTITFTDSITITIFDTTFVSINDTVTADIFVTDTLIVNAVLTGINPPNNINTLKVFPNPTNDYLTINTGNFASMRNYTIKVVNVLSQIVFSSLVNQQEFTLDLNIFDGKGIYFLEIYDNNNVKIDVRKIILQ